jgi:hypothetical protein
MELGVKELGSIHLSGLYPEEEAMAEGGGECFLQFGKPIIIFIGKFFLISNTGDHLPSCPLTCFRTKFSRVEEMEVGP